MSAPRLEIDLKKIHHNALTLIHRLARQNISVTAVTKAFLGLPRVTNTLLRAGVSALGDSRINNIKAMRRHDITNPMVLIRTPMLSQVDEVVKHVDVSFNSELLVINQLSVSAMNAQKIHGIVLMVELGDLREGIMPLDLPAMVKAVLRLPNIRLVGIGANLACHGGVAPDATNMAELSLLADSIEAAFDIRLEQVSGGNSANLEWALSGADCGRVNNLRLGESILLGCEPLHRQPIEGLHGDAITLVAEVIESKIKPERPWGTIAQAAFGEPSDIIHRADLNRSILALGQQDIDLSGLRAPDGTRILGASSDHLIIQAENNRLAVGDEIRFGLNYSALLRAMTSPFIEKTFAALPLTLGDNQATETVCKRPGFELERH